jgi:peptide-methionine (R)-S-oxide reductase
MYRLLLGIALLGMATWLARADDKPAPAPEKVTRTRVEWSKILSPAALTVMVDSGTERPFTSDLLKEKRAGVYVSAAAPEQVLFRSTDKFDSGTGWPSFTRAASPEVVILKPETHFGVTYAEVLDARTGLHLGHVFDDGPPPTGKRFCINGVALKFVPTEK